MKFINFIGLVILLFVASAGGVLGGSYITIKTLNGEGVLPENTSELIEEGKLIGAILSQFMPFPESKGEVIVKVAGKTPTVIPQENLLPYLSTPLPTVQVYQPPLTLEPATDYSSVQVEHEDVVAIAAAEEDKVAEESAAQPVTEGQVVHVAPGEIAEDANRLVIPAEQVPGWMLPRGIRELMATVPCSNGTVPDTWPFVGFVPNPLVAYREVWVDFSGSELETLIHLGNSCNEGVTAIHISDAFPPPLGELQPRSDWIAWQGIYISPFSPIPEK